MEDIEQLWQAVIDELKMAESELEEDEVLIVESLIDGAKIRVQGIGYRLPCLMRISGTNPEGQSVDILLSVAQFLAEIKFWFRFVQKDDAKSQEVGFHTQLSEATQKQRGASQRKSKN